MSGTCAIEGGEEQQNIEGGEGNAPLWFRHWFSDNISYYKTSVLNLGKVNMHYSLTLLIGAL